MTFGKLAESSLAKAYSLNLDFCELAEICKKLCYCASGYKESSSGDQYYHRYYKIKNNNRLGLNARWLGERVMGFGACHLEFASYNSTPGKE